MRISRLLLLRLTTAAIVLLAGALAWGCYPGRPSGGQAGWSLAARPTQSPAREWRYIVIHHSATATGSAAAFDTYHREVKGWQELAYHFVIGNGAGSGDGQLEVGPRWTRQAAGAHCGTRDGRFNSQGIGICLVGDFEQARPTPAQMGCLRSLVYRLVSRYDIPADNVVGHREALAQAGESRTTLCPGRHLDMAGLRRSVREWQAGSSPRGELFPTTARPCSPSKAGMNDMKLWTAPAVLERDDAVIGAMPLSQLAPKATNGPKMPTDTGDRAWAGGCMLGTSVTA